MRFLLILFVALASISLKCVGQDKFSHLKITPFDGRLMVFNEKTGAIFIYAYDGGKLIQMARPYHLDEAGMPVQSTKADTTLHSDSDLKSVANEILRDLRLIDAAKDQWAIEFGKTHVDKLTTKDLAPYLLAGSRLNAELLAGKCNDTLGNPIEIGVVDDGPRLSKKSFDAVASAVPADFFGPYSPKAPKTESSDPKSIATAILEDLRLVDAAKDMWAIEFGKTSANTPTPKDISPYVKVGSRLNVELLAGKCNDTLGNPIEIEAVDVAPRLSQKSYDAVGTAVAPDFFGPYYQKK